MENIERLRKLLEEMICLHNMEPQYTQNNLQ